MRWVNEPDRTESGRKQEQDPRHRIPVKAAAEMLPRLSATVTLSGP